MKPLLFVLTLISLLVTQPSYAQKNTAAKDHLVWFTDMEKAQKKSAQTHKPIFGFFTGSDWCVWCHKLEHEVFDKPAFIKWAREKVILLELDFPRSKQLSPELAQQNNSLQQAFQVKGYPTVWMFFMARDAATHKWNISPLGSLGYPSGAIPGNEEVKFISEANRILANKKGK